MAQDPPPRPEQQPKPAASEMTFMGEIVSVDAAGKSITVREAKSSSAPSSPSTPPSEAAGKTMTFSTDASTKIAKADRPSASPSTPPAAGESAAKNLELKDLKAGDHVTVKYTSKDGKQVAKSIEVGKKATT
jgi:hypothetical protein